MKAYVVICDVGLPERVYAGAHEALEECCFIDRPLPYIMQVVTELSCEGIVSKVRKKVGGDVHFVVVEQGPDSDFSGGYLMH